MLPDPEMLIADKAYDDDAFVAGRGSTRGIPAQAKRRIPATH